MSDDTSAPTSFPWWCLAPVALLVVVACFQQYRAYAFDLTPWKGGGFGMFSSTDALSSRFIKVYLSTDQGVVPASVPGRLSLHAHRLMAEPSKDRLAYLTSRLGGMVWTVDGARSPEVLKALPADVSFPKQKRPLRARILDTRSLSPENVPLLKVTSVRVELWKYEYVGDGPSLKARRVLKADLPLEK